jgi:hypothetical protein
VNESVFIENNSAHFQIAVEQSKTVHKSQKSTKPTITFILNVVIHHYGDIKRTADIIMLCTQMIKWSSVSKIALK